MKKFPVTVLAGLLAGLAPASAADMIGSYPVYSCALSGPASLATQDDDALKTEVARLMDEGIAATHNERWVHSSRPVFRWAQTTAYACGKAYGYLKSNTRDEQNLETCGCAYNRMVYFMR